MLFGKLLLLALAATAGGQHYPLPANAAIAIGPTQSDAKDPESKIFCPDYHLTEGQLREQFRTYHLLRENGEMENYSYLPCWIDGTVRVNGKTYRWRSRDGNIMSTTWPDGVNKLLVGKPSGDLSAGEEKKQKR